MLITFPRNHFKVNGKWDGIVFPGGALHALPVGNDAWDVSIEIVPSFGILNRYGYDYVCRSLTKSSICNADQIRDFFSSLNGELETSKPSW